MSASMSSIDVLSPDDVSTLVRGATVSLSTHRGEVRPDALLGLFHRDERIISALTVRVDGIAPPLLSASRVGASTDRIALLAALDEYRNGQALLVRRRKIEETEVAEDLELRSFNTERTVDIDICLEADASSVLELRSGHGLRPPLPWALSPDGRVAHAVYNDRQLVTVEADELATLTIEGTELHLSWKAEVNAGDVWRGSWRVVAGSRHVDSGGSIPSGELFGSLHVGGDDNRWTAAVASAVADLNALVISLPEEGLRFVGAGAPWYQAIFGRDSLIVGWQSLPLGTTLALDVLDTLATYQGTTFDRATQQAPGKILHERRIGFPQVFGLEQGLTYYGSVDASALFVMLLAEAYRWGAPIQRVKALLPAARRALHWCRHDATQTDGINRAPFVWYTPDPEGLGNQGWKDSGDCIVHADGSFAEGPIALAEAQAYVYEALRGMARLECDLGDADASHRHENDADTLRAAFVDQFWHHDDALIALALDGNHRPLLVATSNMGQCLWSGIVPDDVATAVAQRVMADDLLTPWGVRTLGSGEKAYNPLGYHLGTVWAHDSAIIAAGLGRYRKGASLRVLSHGLLDAARHFDWRLPELFAGLDTSVDGAPLPYPASCSPQAWAAGAPLLLLRSILGLSPDVPAGVLHLSPMLAAGERLNVSGIRIGHDTVDINVLGENLVSIDGISLAVTTG